ncbi:MAG: hypothetical protein ACI30A_06630 [Paludibacteraceae bacterium]
MNNLKAFFSTIALLLGNEKIAQLMDEYGYEGTPSATVLIEMAKQEGQEFLRVLGEKTQEALKTDEAQTMFLIAAQQANRLTKATGKQTDPAATIVDSTTDSGSATDRSEKALAWFDRISGLLGKGLDSVPDIANAVNGTDKTAAESQYLYELRQREEQQSKKSLYWILGGIGILLVIVVFVIALSKRS